MSLTYSNFYNLYPPEVRRMEKLLKTTLDPIPCVIKTNQLYIFLTLDVTIEKDSNTGIILKTKRQYCCEYTPKIETSCIINEIEYLIKGS